TPAARVLALAARPAAAYAFRCFISAFSAASESGEQHDSSAEHDEEPENADHRDVGWLDRYHHTEHQQNQTQHENGDALQPPTTRRTVESSSPHGGREFGVLGVERALDLVEQSLLVLGEWHGFSSGTGLSVAPEHPEASPAPANAWGRHYRGYGSRDATTTRSLEEKRGKVADIIPLGQWLGTYPFPGVSAHSAGVCAMACSRVAMSRSGGWPAAASSSSSSASPVAEFFSAAEPGTRSLNTPCPCRSLTSSPAALSSSRRPSASKRRCKVSLSLLALPSVACSTSSASAKRPASTRLSTAAYRFDTSTETAPPGAVAAA